MGWINSKDSIGKLLNYLEENTKNTPFTEYKTIIVVGKTKDKFKKRELLYFNNVNTYVVFYLIEEEYAWMILGFHL